MLATKVRDFLSVSGHTILIGGVEHWACVVDAGANRGRFSETLREILPGDYHAVEANPDLVGALQRKPFSSVRHYAISARNEPVILRIARNDEGSSLLQLPPVSQYNAVEVDRVTVPGCTLNRLLDEIPGTTIDLVKLDIEGAEVVALQGATPCTLRRVGQLSIEFHSHESFGFGLRSETKDVIHKLRRCGFLVLDFGLDHSDVLCVNRDLLSVSKRQIMAWSIVAATRRWTRKLAHLFSGLKRPIH